MRWSPGTRWRPNREFWVQRVWGPEHPGREPKLVCMVLHFKHQPNGHEPEALCGAKGLGPVAEYDRDQNTTYLCRVCARIHQAMEGK